MKNEISVTKWLDSIKAGEYPVKNARRVNFRISDRLFWQLNSVMFLTANLDKNTLFKNMIRHYVEMWHFNFPKDRLVSTKEEFRKLIEPETLTDWLKASNNHNIESQSVHVSILIDDRLFWQLSSVMAIFFTKTTFDEVFESILENHLKTISVRQAVTRLSFSNMLNSATVRKLFIKC